MGVHYRICATPHRFSVTMTLILLLLQPARHTSIHATKSIGRRDIFPGSSAKISFAENWNYRGLRSRATAMIRICRQISFGRSAG